jgi:hypothetical protein
MSLRIETDGAELIAAASPPDEIAALRALADSLVIGRAGVRLFGRPMLDDILAAPGRIGRLAATHLGDAARPVRALLFDKTADANWAVPWHQDRTVAVCERRDIEGFSPWSTKAGVPHVEPPFAIIERMVTIRAHLDDCDADNAPLLIAPGSHRAGRVPAKQVADVARERGSRACLAAAGDAWIYATSIIHASERARLPRRRRVLHVDYAGEALPDGLAWLGV